LEEAPDVIVAAIGKLIMYLCLALIMGYWMLQICPQDRQPAVHIPRWVLVTAYLLFPVTLLIPPTVLSYVIAPQVEENFGQVFKSVLVTFEMGETLLAGMVLIGCLGLVHLARKFMAKKVAAWVGFILAIGLVLAQSWSSHAATVTEHLGFFAQSFHVLAISLWIGTLFVVAWFGKNFERWPSFLSWYTPLAILSVVTIVVTGIIMMTFIVPQPVQSLILPYGQTLLIKHLVLIPVLLFAFFNGVWFRRQLKQGGFNNPRPWIRAESVLALIIFSITANLSRESPPHDQLAQALQYAGPSPLFSLFLPEVTEAGKLFLSFSWLALILVLASVSIVLLFFRSGSKSASLLLLVSAAVVLLIYLAIMLSLDHSSLGSLPFYLC
jgi:putative copper resistance protein D